MLVSLVYLLFRRALAVAALRLRSREFKELEIVVLRHELAVLRRQVARPRLEETDRVFLAAASRLLSGVGWQSFFVRPETLLGWLRGFKNVDSCCGAVVFVDQSAEPVAAFDLAAGRWPRRVCRVGREQRERPVWALAVVVGGVDA